MMSQVIAGIYEIQNQVGSGGGGIVYLGQHLRLKKKIVIKEDKRTLNTRADLLRREVDMLKDLSHTYIPQVYDFVQENNAVYTVMDFIRKRGDCPAAAGDCLGLPAFRGAALPAQPAALRHPARGYQAGEYYAASEREYLSD